MDVLIKDLQHYSIIYKLPELDKAADEITRPRAELAAEREQKFRHMDNSTKLCNELMAIRADNERLREALQPFADKATQWEGQPERQITVMLSECRRARAALESMTETPNVP